MNKSWYHTSLIEWNVKLISWIEQKNEGYGKTLGGHCLKGSTLSFAQCWPNMQGSRGAASLLAASELFNGRNVQHCHFSHPLFFRITKYQGRFLILDCVDKASQVDQTFIFPVWIMKGGPDLHEEVQVQELLLCPLHRFI